jgi:YidC/Oxa1 family membrane protein insertase
VDNRRLFLLFALAAVLYLLWNAWENQFHGVVTAPTRARVTQPHSVSLSSSAPSSLPTPPGVIPAPSPHRVPVHFPQKRSAYVRVRTHVLSARIADPGGTLLRVALLHYRKDLSPKSPPVTVLHERGTDRTILVSGLEPIGEAAAPVTRIVVASPARRVRCLRGCKVLTVPLVWRGAKGLRVVKQYVFRPDSYVVRLRYFIRNGTDRPWRVAPYVYLRGTHVHRSYSFFNPKHLVYSGLGYARHGTYHKISYHHLRRHPFERTIRSGWIARIDNYFLATLIPPAGETWRYFARTLRTGGYEAGAVGGVLVVPPHAARRVTLRLYLGPKLQRRLAAVAPALRQTVDYGYMTILAEPLYDLLAFIERIVGNWGWAIVLLTLIIKLLFFPLQRMSGTSMARMRALQPRMRALRERYAEDKTRLTQAMMELYKKEKVNPAAGCLPMLVQFPIYIALYWVLLFSVELRHAPFVLWIRDLSAPDSYYILPVLYAATLAVYQRLVPQMTTDQFQARLMTIVVPMAVAGVSLFMPAGLVLYWLVGGIFNILQQWHINRLVGASKPKHA